MNKTDGTRQNSDHSESGLSQEEKQRLAELVVAALKRELEIERDRGGYGR